jgi:hypothetical protein
MSQTQEQKNAVNNQVILKLDHIDDEVMWPVFDGNGNEMRVGWVDAFAGTKALLLNVKRIRKIFAFGGKLYVVYDAEVASRYERFAVSSLPELAVELKFEIYEDRIHDGDNRCRIYRLAIDAADEVRQFISKLLRVEVGHNYLMLLPQSRPLNFTLTPIDVALFGHHIKGIAVAENPAFDFLGDRDEYRGKYAVVVVDDGFYMLFRIKADPSYLPHLQDLARRRGFGNNRFFFSSSPFPPQPQA